MKKFLFVILGLISVALGAIGIVVPGLPTTIFLIIAAALFAKSSERLHNWLLNNKVFGKYIHAYHRHKAMPLKSKITALLLMWISISISVYFIESLWIASVVILCGVTGTIVIYRVKTLRDNQLT